MPSRDDIAHEHRLLETYRRNVKHYVNQAAAFGGEDSAPIHIVNGLREARENIARIKVALRGLGVMIEDLRTDFLPVSETPEPPVANVVPPNPEDEFTYDVEEQSWYTDGAPVTTRVRRSEIEHVIGSMRVLLLTVNEHEFFAVGHLLQPLPNYERILQVSINQETYYLGMYGYYPTVLTKSHMGSVGLGASLLVTSKAQELWKPQSTIAVGIAFGMDRAKQHIGDVLVAREIVPYNPIRAGEKVIERGQHLASDPTLVNRFENSYDWRFMCPDGKRCRIHYGSILSGEELIDNPKRKAELVQRYPEAIGGEMEGTGLSAASFYGNRHWILVKAICDWADGTKNSTHQPLAAASAASLVHHVLSDPDALDNT